MFCFEFEMNMNIEIYDITHTGCRVDESHDLKKNKKNQMFLFKSDFLI